MADLLIMSIIFGYSSLEDESASGTDVNLSNRVLTYSCLPVTTPRRKVTSGRTEIDRDD